MQHRGSAVRRRARSRQAVSARRALAPLPNSRGPRALPTPTATRQYSTWPRRETFQDRNGAPERASQSTVCCGPQVAKTSPAGETASRWNQPRRLRDDITSSPVRGSKVAATCEVMATTRSVWGRNPMAKVSSSSSPACTERGTMRRRHPECVFQIAMPCTTAAATKSPLVEMAAGHQASPKRWIKAQLPAFQMLPVHILSCSAPTTNTRSPSGNMATHMPCKDVAKSQRVPPELCQMKL
mmetsp:Transcript_6182/g.16984  ORF Transcript_6182/g.16984 Transcript_6182/m.16984 type:complete len:240 (+) Transcript_6182:20-739(+)